MSCRAKPASCHGCPCLDHGTDFSAITGTCSTGVMCVAEASGEHEARAGYPLVEFAPAGSLFERIIRRMGLSREQFALTNVLRCRPRGNWFAGAPWEYGAIEHCRANLQAAIAKYRPRVLFAMGDIPLRVLTGSAGTKQGIGYMRGYVLPSHLQRRTFAPGCPQHQGNPSPTCLEYGCLDLPAPDLQAIPVASTWHPSHLRRGKIEYMGMWARDLQRAIDIAAGRDTQWTWEPDQWLGKGLLRYNLHPSLDDLICFRNRLLEGPHLRISKDIETPESASMDEDAREGFKDTLIRQIQFSVGVGEAIAVPWEHPYKKIIIEILHLSNDCYGHNWNLYDDKVIRATANREGWSYRPTSQMWDTLDMFHHWQPDLPAHLQCAASYVKFPFPWKHLHDIKGEPFYGCCDVDAGWRLGEMLVATLKHEGLWGDSVVRGYTGQVYNIRPVLTKMETHGLPVNEKKRLELGTEFDHVIEEINAEIDAQVPDEIKNVEPRRGRKGNYSYGYINTPKDTTGLALRSFQEAGVDGEGNPIVVTVERWCRVLPFNANSPDQLKAYMRLRGYKVPKSVTDKDPETGEGKETTAKKELVRLAQVTGDNLFLRAVELKETIKAKGTYIEGFKPHADGRAHTTFTFDTAIAQLSSRNPNIQNFPKHGRLAKPLGYLVQAEPGHVLTRWDYKSCHVLTLGYLAEDPNYIRLARLDMHSFVAGHFLGLWDGPSILPETDEQLMARFKWLKSDPERKKIRDDQAKHAILGIGNGLKPKGLWERYPENFPSRTCPECVGVGKVTGLRGLKACPKCSGTKIQTGMAIAAEFFAITQRIFPKVFVWQDYIQHVAHDKQCLITEFQHIRRFYEVYRPKNGKWGPGDQSEQAISFWLSNIAFGYIREHMLELDKAGIVDRDGLFDNIHDDFDFMVREDRLEDHIREVHPILVAPSKVLMKPSIAPQGLHIDVELSIGPSWSELEEYPLK